jgi:hypothetical protein
VRRPQVGSEQPVLLVKISNSHSKLHQYSEINHSKALVSEVAVL